MLPIIFVGLALILVVVLFSNNQKQRNKKALEKLRAQWGKPKNESFNFTAIEKYFHLGRVGQAIFTR